MNKPTAGSILTSMGAAYLTQWAHDRVRPLVRVAIDQYPGLEPDTLSKKILVNVAAGLPGAIKEFFPDKDQLHYFSSILIQEVILELKSSPQRGATPDSQAPRTQNDSVSSAGQETLAVVQAIGRGLEKAASSGAKLVAGLPKVLKDLDAKVTASAARGAERQSRLLEIERFCRAHKVMDRTGFKKWALDGNIDLTNLTAKTIPERFMTGKRR